MSPWIGKFKTSASSREKSSVETFFGDERGSNKCAWDDTDMVNIKWWWAAMLGGSILLAVPGHSEIGAIVGDVVGHFFSAMILAIVPILGYWLFYKQISEKEITYIFSAAWIYLVLSQFFGWY